MRFSRTTVGLGLVGVCVLAGAGCGGGSSGASTRAATASSSGDAPPSITAQGLGRVTGVPDVLTVAFNLHTEGASAQQTLADNSTQTQSVLDALKGQGVDEKDVRTTNVSVGPRYDNRTPPRISGYAADNSFTVKLRDSSKAGAQIDALVGVGGDAVQVQGIGYSIDDSTALLSSARADAVKRATDQARGMADAAGVTLGGIRSISEVPAESASPFGQTRYADALGGGAAASTAVPLAPGSQELTVSVTVVFDIG